MIENLSEREARSVKVKIDLDNKQYTQKPDNLEISILRNRLCNPNAITEIELEDLTIAIERGQSFTPAVMTGTSGDTWQSQQLICLDIDNKCEEPLKPETALTYLAEIGLQPCFMYYTFSNKPEWPKYRIVFVLETALTNQAQAETAIKSLSAFINITAGIVNVTKDCFCADPGIKDAARILFGSTKGSVFYYEEHITKIETLEKLPTFETMLEQISEQTAAPEIRPTGADLDSLNAQFEYDKMNFDLASYILQTAGGTIKKVGKSNYINPCPLCGHNNDFVVTGAIYHDFGASGGSGGTIIDYLMNKENLTIGEAMEKFKFEIMNYDRAQWKQAYLDSTKTPENAPKTEIVPRTDYLTAFNTKIHSRAFEPLKTGIGFFDNLLGGGILRQSLILLLAAPGAGKTTLAQQIAEALAAQKQPVIYVSLEMSHEQMLAKIFSAKLADIKTPMTPAQILQAYNWTEAQETAFNCVYEEYRREIFPCLEYITGTSDLKTIMETITARAEAAHAAGEPAPAVFVDYLHLIRMNGQKEVAEIIKESLLQFKNNYAVPYNTFVFAISATNREAAKNGEVSMYSGRDTSGIEFTGDYIITLNAAKEQTGPKDTIATEIYLAKGRLIDRSKKSVTIYLHGSSSHFTDKFIPGDKSTPSTRQGIRI